MIISEEDLARFQQYIRPVATPPGFSSYDIVRRDIAISPEMHHAIYDAFMEAGCR